MHLKSADTDHPAELSDPANELRQYAEGLRALTQCFDDTVLSHAAGLYRRDSIALKAREILAREFAELLGPVIPPPRSDTPSAS